MLGAGGLGADISYREKQGHDTAWSPLANTAVSRRGLGAKSMRMLQRCIGGFQPFRSTKSAGSTLSVLETIAWVFNDPLIIGGMPRFKRPRAVLQRSRSGIKPGWWYHLRVAKARRTRPTRMPCPVGGCRAKVGLLLGPDNYLQPYTLCEGGTYRARESGKFRRPRELYVI